MEHEAVQRRLDFFRSTSMVERSKGLYRQPAGDDEPVAYVVSGSTATFVTESEYRADGIEPPFEALPSQDQYEEALEKEDVEATEDANVAADRPYHSRA
jgi:hypothetical protein